MKYKYILLFSPLFFPKHVANTGIRPKNSSPFSFVMSSSIPSHQTGKGSPLSPTFSSPSPTRSKLWAAAPQDSENSLNTSRESTWWSSEPGPRQVHARAESCRICFPVFAQREDSREGNGFGRLGMVIKRDGCPCWWQSFWRAPRPVSFRLG